MDNPSLIRCSARRAASPASAGAPRLPRPPRATTDRPAGPALLPLRSLARDQQPSALVPVPANSRGEPLVPSRSLAPFVLTLLARARRVSRRLHFVRCPSLPHPLSGRAANGARLHLHPPAGLTAPTSAPGAARGRSRRGAGNPAAAMSRHGRRPARAPHMPGPPLQVRAFSSVCPPPPSWRRPRRPRPGSGPCGAKPAPARRASPGRDCTQHLRPPMLLQRCRRLHANRKTGFIKATCVCDIN